MTLTLFAPTILAANKSSVFDVLLAEVPLPPSERVTHRYADGTEYTGEWQEGLPSGDGKLKLPDGAMYIGSFKAGLPDGTGIFQDAQGNLYKGEWFNGLREGLGMMEFSSGNKYEGEWHQDKREGKGLLLFPSGTRFEGLWKQDLRHGRGDMQYKTGERYSGDYAFDLQHGFGTVIESDGSIYAGTFSKGKRHGVGDCTDRAGKTETCVYNKGERVIKAAVLARASGFKSRHEPQFEFKDGVALLWEDNFTKGKGVVSEPQVHFTRKMALIRSELRIESKSQDFFLLIVVRDYKGPGQYRLNGEDVVITLDGEVPLFLAGADSCQLDITADRGTIIEGQIVAPKLYANGDSSKSSFAIRRGQFKAMPGDFQQLENAAAERNATLGLRLIKSTQKGVRAHKPLSTGINASVPKDLVDQPDEQGQKQSGDNAIEPHGKR